jgi:Tol biopolymer transport system component
MSKHFILTVFLFLAGRMAIAQITYPGNTLPADTPAIFAPGLLTDGFNNRDFTISPAGDEVFYTLQQRSISTILHLKKVNGQWSKPEVAPFAGKYRDLEASFSPDGKTLFFASDRPLQKDSAAKKDFDIWQAAKLPNGNWGEPVNLGPVVNTAKNEFYPSVTKNGNLYFTVEADYGKGKEDIVVCKLTKQGYTAPVSLGEGVNSAKYEFNAFVDPDEEYILFTSFGREDDMGGGDLYISHKDKNGAWLPAKHLPAGINSAVIDYCPYVSPDKKYLIFTSSRLNKQMTDGKPKNYKLIQKLVNSPGNGQDDLYWLKFNNNW